MFDLDIVFAEQHLEEGNGDIGKEGVADDLDVFFSSEIN